MDLLHFTVKGLEIRVHCGREFISLMLVCALFANVITQDTGENETTASHDTRHTKRLISLVENRGL